MRGDPQTSPWIWGSGDYQNRLITITVPFDEATRAIVDGTVVHRDDDCLWSHIVWDDPSNNQKAKRSPVVPFGDTTLTAQQLRQATTFRTIDDILAVQVTAEP